MDAQFYATFHVRIGRWVGANKRSRQMSDVGRTSGHRIKQPMGDAYHRDAEVARVQGRRQISHDVMSEMFVDGMILQNQFTIRPGYRRHSTT